jgi:hypothetical protein
MRAAAIAAGMIHALSHDMTVEELVGWMRRGDGRERGSYPKSHAWQVGWLAATIFGHEFATTRHVRRIWAARGLRGTRLGAHPT